MQYALSRALVYDVKNVIRMQEKLYTTNTL